MDSTTKKRILFVDDEPLVLQGLQRMLRSLRGEWDMEFTDSGSKALEIMAARPFEVIVSDMRMPGMSGAELMNIIIKRHPDTIRIILSGHADREMIAQCLGAAHQFLSKPCDPELLKAVINQACLVGSDLSSSRVKEVVGRIERLPSVPAVFRALSKALASENVSSAELGEIIAQDMGMTAKILKLVNSAFFGLRRELSSPVEAVTYLGIDTVHALVLANGIFDEAGHLNTRDLTIDQLWSHSLSVAHGTKAIAKLLKLPEKSREQAFTGGILHDSGILILASNFPETYNEVLDLVVREQLMLPLAEQRVFGVNHAEVGAYLMGLWGLPNPVIQCIRHHHAPTAADVEDIAPLISVHLADAFLSSMSHHYIFEHSAVDPALASHPDIAPRMSEFRAAVKASLFIPPEPHEVSP